MNGRRVLVTGATGSFGQAFVAEVLARWPDIERLVVFSRDELKQSEMARRFPVARYPQMRYFLGDVRDRDRLRRALEGIDTVVHAAALKQVDTAEYNPMEFIKTNIMGAENLVEACIDAGVSRVVALSTDKAAAPINLYGATKLCSDKLFIAANNFRGGRDLRFSVVRYGNVLGSRGSVVPLFIERARTGVLPLTDPRMTRFSMLMDEGIELVLWALEHAVGGELFVAKAPAYRIADLAEAIGPSCRREIVGMRPGEKLHEDLITESDSPTTLDLDSCFVVLPAGSEISRASHGGALVPEGFSYNSGRIAEHLSVERLRELIKTHVDPGFEPV